MSTFSPSLVMFSTFKRLFSNIRNLLEVMYLLAIFRLLTANLVREKEAMPAAQGSLDAASSSTPLPLPSSVLRTTRSFMELFKGLPDSDDVLNEICQANISRTSRVSTPMATQHLTATTRVVMEWTSSPMWDPEKRDFKNEELIVEFEWQEWRSTDPTCPPWAGNYYLQFYENTVTRSMARKLFPKTPEGMRQAIAYAKQTWKIAKRGPCEGCDGDARQSDGAPLAKRLRLDCSGMCAGCTVSKAVIEE
jgi:hypothetical protein